MLPAKKEETLYFILRLITLINISVFQLIKELSIRNCEFPHFRSPLPLPLSHSHNLSGSFLRFWFQSYWTSLSQLTFAPEQPPVPGPLSGRAALRVLEEANEEEHQHGHDQPRPRRHPPSESRKSCFPRT